MTRSRTVLAGAREAGAAERAAAARLTHSPAHPVLAVALLPIHAHGRFFGLMELGRRDHVFRADDVDCLNRAARALGVQLDSRDCRPS
jgi:hypothetical protein